MLRVPLEIPEHGVVITTAVTELEDSSSILAVGQFSIPVLQNLCSEAVGKWNFSVLVEDADTGVRV